MIASHINSTKVVTRLFNELIAHLLLEKKELLSQSV